MQQFRSACNAQIVHSVSHFTPKRPYENEHQSLVIVTDSLKIYQDKYDIELHQYAYTRQYCVFKIRCFFLI